MIGSPPYYCSGFTISVFFIQRPSFPGVHSRINSAEGVRLNDCVKQLLPFLHLRTTESLVWHSVFHVRRPRHLGHWTGAGVPNGLMTGWDQMYRRALRSFWRWPDLLFSSQPTWIQNRSECTPRATSVTSVASALSFKWRNLLLVYWVKNRLLKKGMKSLDAKVIMSEKSSLATTSAESRSRNQRTHSSAKEYNSSLAFDTFTTPPQESKTSRFPWWRVRRVRNLLLKMEENTFERTIISI